MSAAAGSTRIRRGSRCAMGMAFCPEDRKAEGIFGELTVRENIVLGLQTKRGWLSRLSHGEQEQLAQEMIKALAIATPDADKPVGQLSGGNQQKVVLARALVSGSAHSHSRRADARHRRRRPRRGGDADPQALRARAWRCWWPRRSSTSSSRSATGSRCCAIGEKSARSRARDITRENDHPHHRGRARHDPALGPGSGDRALPPVRVRLSGLRALAGHRAIWPLMALALILAVDGSISPGFFHIRIVEGRLFGNLIDILYRAVPTALVALGMAVVIGTKGIDLSVGSVIAIVGAVITWRIHAGDPHFVILLIALGVGRPVRPVERVSGRHSRHPADHRDLDPDGQPGAASD